MGQIFGVARAVGGLARNEGPEGPPDNRYWRNRVQHEDWKLREHLLSGNVRIACLLLGLPDPDPPNCFSRMLRCLRCRKKTYEEELEERKPLEYLNLHEMTWEEDRGQNVLHYLAVGRQLITYQGMHTNFPITGNHSPGPTAHASAVNRLRLVSLLLQHGKISAEVVTRFYLPVLSLCVVQ